MVLVDLNHSHEKLMKEFRDPQKKVLVQVQLRDFENASFSGWWCWFGCLTSWFFEQKRDDLVFPSFWVLVWLVSLSNSSASVDNEVGKVPFDRLVLARISRFHPFVKRNLVWTVDSWNLAHHVKSNSVLFLKLGWAIFSKSLGGGVRGQASLTSSPPPRKIYPKMSKNVRKWPEKIRKCPENVPKYPEMSKKCRETVQNIRNVPKKFKNVPKMSKISENFRNCLKI